VAVEVRILGPVEVLGSNGVIPVPPRVLDLVAILACRPNDAVSAGQLIDALWPGGPPRTSTKSLQVRVHELRRALGDSARVRYERQGYRLVMDAGELDAGQFEDLLGRGRASFAAGEFDRAAELIRQALALWRGPAFANQDHAKVIWREAARLNELRWQSTEELIDIELLLGRHGEIVGNLRRLVAEHPFREHVHAQFMLALCRLGRYAEALAVYREARGRLVEELGVEPGRELQDLHQAILTHDPVLEAEELLRWRRGGSGSKVVPAELPADVSAFTGRSSDVERLRTMLVADSGSTAIVAISGLGGVGKSAFAVHVAHAVAADFPDGQLFVDLHGAAAGLARLAPIDVLGRFLRALGVDRPPVELDEAAARFRSLTAGRRILVVLDNAADVVQVRPLLPGGCTSAVLTTSRIALSTLDGAAQVRLDTLTEDEAVTLLSRFAGTGRVISESASAAQVAQLCGYLPLALRICAARLVVNPGQTLAGIAVQLSDLRRRLDYLQHADLAVRTSIMVSHRDLESGPNGTRAFHLLELIALLDAPDVSTAAAAALAGQPVDQIQVALDRLTETQLLQAGAPGRYRLHDLIRLYAGEQAVARIPDPDRQAALQRAFAHYTAICAMVTDLLDQGQAVWLTASADESVPAGAPRSMTEAIAWFDVERANLVAALRQAASFPSTHTASALSLAAALNSPLQVRGYWQDWIMANETAVSVAQRVGERAAEARARMFLGFALGQMGRQAEEVAHVEQSLVLWRDTGDRLGESGALNACSTAYLHQRRYRESRECLQRSLQIRQQMGDLRGETMLLDNIGITYRHEGRLEEAIVFHERALAVARDVGCRRSETHALENLAVAQQMIGRCDDAIRSYEQSRDNYRQIGEPYREALALWGLGTVLHSLDQTDRARDCWREALTILHRLGRITAEQVDAALSSPTVTMPEAIQLIS
jgi:DNA-binding SARP family transcriptional activator